MFAYWAELTLVVFGTFITTGVFFAYLMVKKDIDADIAKNPKSGGTAVQKTLSVFMTAGGLALAYFATIGSVVGNFPLVLFTVQASTSIYFTARGIFQTESAPTIGNMFCSLIYSFGLLAAYIVLGVVYY